MNRKRNIIIGLDGVPFGMLEKFARTGVMPNTAAIIDKGFFTPMYSSVPEISSVAWSSIVTAVNPAKHGVFGFIDLHPNSYNMRFPNFSDLKAEPFWNQTASRSVIINVPSTYPVRSMNGVHISGFVSIDFEKSVYPRSLQQKLKKLDYRLDVDAQQAHSSMQLFIEDIDKTLDARIEAYKYLWDSEDWQNFMLVFTGTDRLMHFLWNAYEDQTHQYHDFFIEHFRKIDTAIGRIINDINEDDTLIMLSDHGFERLEKDIYINHLLMTEGFLTFKSGTPPKLGNICPGTRAFALDPARIYINQKGKYPAGSVNPQEKQACIKDLEDLFDSLKIEGRKVIKYIYRKEQVYKGPYLDEAPDLILIADRNFNLKGAMTSNELVAKGPFTGKHTYEDAFLLIRDNTDTSALGQEHISVVDAGKFIRVQA